MLQFERNCKWNVLLKLILKDEDYDFKQLKVCLMVEYIVDQRDYFMYRFFFVILIKLLGFVKEIVFNVYYKY